MKKIIIILFLLLIPLVPIIVLAAGSTCTPTYSGSGLCNALPSFGGQSVTDIPSLITASFSWLATIVGTILMVMLFYSGARMIFAQGDPTAITTAKNSFKYTIIGFVVSIFAYLIVSSLQYFLNVKSGPNDNPTANNNFFYNPINSNDAVSYFQSLAENFLAIIGTIAVMYIIISGFRYLTAGGNDAAVKSAKESITWSVVGLICILLSYTIIQVLFATFQ